MCICNVAEDILKTALSLYMGDSALPLPTFEEILICNSETSCEQV